MFRGEIDGRGAASWTSFKNLLCKEIGEGKLHVLAQIDARRKPDLQKVPLLTELVAHDPQKLAIARFISKTLSRSLAAPPGVPAERVAILRQGIADVVKDREFLAAAGKLSLDIGFVPGAEVEALIKDALSTPKDVIEATKAVMKL
jgi:tripartite-type tricarboxylate transporter receptor subunit TctC